MRSVRMMKIKKLLSLVLAILTIFTLCACSMPAPSEKAGDKLAYVSENILYPGSKSIFVNYKIFKADSSITEIRYTAGEENKFLVYDYKTDSIVYSVFYENGLTYFAFKGETESTIEQGDMLYKYWNESDLDFSKYLDSSLYSATNGEELYNEIMFDYEKFTDKAGNVTVFYFNQSTGKLRYKLEDGDVYEFVSYTNSEDVTYLSPSSTWVLAPQR